MAAATTTVGTPGRGPNDAVNPAFVLITISAVATTYTAASGGLPFDLTSALQAISATMIPSGQAPNYVQTVNVADIMGVLAFQSSTNGFIPMGFQLGTPTYSAVPWQSASGPDATPGVLLTCPCTIRLFGTGAANQAALAQIADGAVTDTITLILLINRNGANN